MGVNSLLSYGSGDGTQVVMLGSKCPPNRLTDTPLPPSEVLTPVLKETLEKDPHKGSYSPSQSAQCKRHLKGLAVFNTLRP